MVQTEANDNAERKVLADISKYGWHCANILAESDAAPYSFTVGLYETYGHAELIVFGLKPQVAHKILCNATADLPGGRLDLLLPTDAIVAGYPCCFVEVAKSQYCDFVGFARWYYKGNDFPLYQIVWPSREGRFPWHPSASKEFKLAQHVIAQAPVGG